MIPKIVMIKEESYVVNIGAGDVYGYDGDQSVNMPVRNNSANPGLYQLAQQVLVWPCPLNRFVCSL